MILVLPRANLYAEHIQIWTTASPATHPKSREEQMHELANAKSHTSQTYKKYLQRELAQSDPTATPNPRRQSGELIMSFLSSFENYELVCTDHVSLIVNLWLCWLADCPFLSTFHGMNASSGQDTHDPILNPISLPSLLARNTMSLHLSMEKS